MQCGWRVFKMHNMVLNIIAVLKTKTVLTKSLFSNVYSLKV